jgi:CRP/FNR family transcriptional regulator, cyclic AMP receptor protein
MTVRDLALVLRQCPAFTPLPAREIDALAALAIAESHRARDHIFDEGDPALWLYVVRSGHVKIVRHSHAGRDVVLELLGPGDIFGAVAVLTPSHRPPSSNTAARRETSGASRNIG